MKTKKLEFEDEVIILKCFVGFQNNGRILISGAWNWNSKWHGLFDTNHKRRDKIEHVEFGPTLFGAHISHFPRERLVVGNITK